jgi:hypothetical protein
MNNQHNPTQMIKSKFSNRVNDILNPEHGKNNYPFKVSGRVNKMTTEQKLALLNQIVAAHVQTSSELRDYWYNRREKKRINKMREASRIARGIKPKNKTTKEQWEAMQTQAAG